MSYTSTPQYAFVAWCSVKAQGLYIYIYLTFTFTFTTFAELLGNFASLSSPSIPHLFYLHLANQELLVKYKRIQ
jgi:hypothetical protein